MNLDLIRLKAAEGHGWALRKLAELENQKVDKPVEVEPEKESGQPAFNSSKEIIRRVRAMINIYEDLKSSVNDWDDNWACEEVYNQWKDEGLIEPLVKIEVREVVRQPISSQEKLEYQALYRQKQRLLELQREQTDKQEMKIAEALKRKLTHCYHCKKFVSVVEPKAVLEKKKRSKRVHIIVESKCPECMKICRTFGGYST